MTFFRQVWALCEESGALVIPLTCQRDLREEPSATLQEVHEENTTQKNWTHHLKGIRLKPLYEECIVPVQEKGKKATWPIKLGTYALDFSEFKRYLENDRNLGKSQVRHVTAVLWVFR